MERDYQLSKRRYVIAAAVLLVVVLYILRLFALQILRQVYGR